MKFIKKIVFITLVLVTILSFTKVEKDVEALSLNDIDAMSILSRQELGARPSSKFTFYVDTDLVKKARGYSLLKSSIYIYERTTGKYNLLATKQIISPIHKETFLDYEIAKYNSNTKLLKNGDKILSDKEKSQYSFNELIDFRVIYNSYLVSKNKLIKK
jgi:hypothetical protein